MIKRVTEGCVLPRFYGVAWIDYSRAEAICLPIPLNWLAGILRDFAYWLKVGRRHGISDIYSKGYSDGLKAGKELEPPYYSFVE